MTEVPAAVQELAADRQFRHVRPAGGGVEFRVFRATAPDGSDVVLRTPAGARFQSDPCDRDGYGDLAPASPGPFWIYRLDAAVMLALLFCSDPAHAALAPRAVDRLREVLARLSRELARP
jgi:hypothetical protein